MADLNLSFKIGDFAQLCDTTIDTLLHYEDVGLLVPVVKKPNGWRYYQFVQFFTFLTIASLKQSGCSLEEVRKYLSCSDLNVSLQLLKERRAVLEAEIQKLNRSQKALAESIESLKQAQSRPMNEIRRVEIPEEYILLEDTSPSAPVFEGKNLTNIRYIRDRIIAYNHLCENQNDTWRILPCLLFSRERIQTGDCQRCNCFRPMKTRERKNNNARIKPGGEYLSMITEGLWPESFYDQVDIITQYLRQNQLTLAGDVYIYPLKTTRMPENKLKIVYEVNVPIQNAGLGK